MDYIATLYLFYIYLKCSELQSVGTRAEKKDHYVVQMTASAGCLKQGHLFDRTNLWPQGFFPSKFTDAATCVTEAKLRINLSHDTDGC